MIKEVPINDNWLYRQGFNPKCVDTEYELSDSIWADSYIVQLPHNVSCTSADYFDETQMHTLSTYSRLLNVPETYNGKRLILKFEGVLSYAEVYVNGIFVTSHRGESQFTADITAPVKYNYDNRIVIKVDSSYKDNSMLPRGPLTQFGGICRDVIFMICDGRDIRDVCVRTSKVGENRVVTADVELFDYYPDTELEGEIIDSAGKKVCSLTTRTVQNSNVRLKGEAADVQCWSPDNPVLYTAVIRLKSDNRTFDIKRTEFGFVTAKFKRDGFYLNEKPLKLIGLLRADCYPSIGRSATSETERRDARLIKKSGCNAVRTMGIASRDFIDECNKIGLLVIEDVYGDGFIGTDPNWREGYVSDVTDMILRDRNNPCVIGWGVRVNNSADCDELYFKAVKAAKEADPTRATVGARSFVSSRMYEDVFALNEVNRTSRSKRTPAKLFVPYIIGEHCGKVCPSAFYDRESVRLEQALRHLEAINDAMGGAAAGAFGMSFCDFNTGRGHGSGDNVNRFGVFDSHRNPKLAAYAYISQTDGEPVMELSSNLSECDYSGSLYVFTNADSIIMYRNGERVGEFFPDTKTYPNLKHPPVVINDFCGELPAAEVGTGIKLKMFKSVLDAFDKRGAGNLGFAASKKVYALRKILKLDKFQMISLLEKYSRIPPEGATYTFEAVYGGEVKLTRTLSRDINKTLKIVPSCGGVLKCTKSYERIEFSLFAEDGFGNILDYCFMPVTVSASGSLAVDGKNHISLQGGRGGFYVRSITQGTGVVTVTTDLGTRSFKFECEYSDIERF